MCDESNGLAGSGLKPLGAGTALTLLIAAILTLPGCSKVNPNLKIFAKGREYEYDATYYSSANELLTENTVTLSGTGKPWKYDPDQQSLIICRYEYNADHEKAYSPHPLNPSANRKWRTRATTGAIENPTGVWIHPIRENQFLSTEVAPFPQVPLPLKIGSTYAWKLPIPNGQWGIWGGKNDRIQVPSRVTGRKGVGIPYRTDRMLEGDRGIKI